MLWQRLYLWIIQKKGGGEGNDNNRDEANKEDIKIKVLETNSDDEDEENKQERGDKPQEDCEMSNVSENASWKDVSNKQKSGGKSKIRDDNVMTEVVPTDNQKKGGGGKR